MNTLGQRDAGTDLVGQCVLHLAEQVACARKGQRHGPKLVDNFVPLLNTSTLLGNWDAGKDLGQSRYAMWRQVNGHRLRVDDPSQNELDGGPRAITVPQLLEGDWLAAKRAVRRIEGAEDVVNGVQEDTSYLGRPADLGLAR